MEPVEHHKRVNRTISDFWERPLLRFLAGKCPATVTPDMLSFIALGGSAMTFAAYLLVRMDISFVWLANFGLFLNWLGDSLDGTLARYRKIERPRYGYFLDHYFDSLSIFLVCLGMGLSGYVRMDFVLLAMSAYFLMNVLVHMNMLTRGLFKISYLGSGPTELRLAIIAGNSFVYFWGNPLISAGAISLSIGDILLLANAAALYIIFIVSGASTCLHLHAEGK